MAIINLPKESCECCLKHINIGQAITECFLCKTIVHSKCLKKTNITQLNNNYYCENCAMNVDVRYNPFLSAYSNMCTTGENTHFYDEELADTADLIRKSSDILQNS